MKKYSIKLVFVLSLLFAFSCEDYLDVAPQALIGEEDAFKDFVTTQGFLEEMYNLVVDYHVGGNGGTDYLLGDETVINQNYQTSAWMDRGNYLFLYEGTAPKWTYLIGEGGGNQSASTGTAWNRPGVWDGSLRGIRKANQILEKIDDIVNLTTSERDILLGQAYFFRAFFHFEIMKFWGRFPYIDATIVGDNFRFSRPDTYKETALKIHEDFKLAAELLPQDWDTVELAGQLGGLTVGKNKTRVTKGAVYAFMGKNLLIAASPLMKGSRNTYDYDTELAEMAVDAFAEVLKLADQGAYSLASFGNYEQVFMTRQNKIPGLNNEFIFNGSANSRNSSRNIARMLMSKQVLSQGSFVMSPTHNFIHANFGMANGLSVEDDLSGNYGAPTFDATKPFENRDPRFYEWVTYNGAALGTRGGQKYRTAALYNGGIHRTEGLASKGSQTGYFIKKFYPFNYTDRFRGRINGLTIRRIRMRLTDVYLMYAEALHAAKNNATTAPTSYSLTAENVLNLMRSRAGIPNVNQSIVADPNKFMDELRRERSVELSFEAHRWVDIRRWVLAHLDKYKNKTGVDFDANYTFFNERLVVPRVCEYPKHYWLPFRANQTQFYEGFEQNPGW
ncbi:RagB/SusD family nutrient uptake outer membrane protein [Polaribacter sp.]|uniref:RagB/SusD family nutrient uptake outer membrane protein n=1 Tax=Polaribacter sp. TaxID=1920175 RepID=UPI0026012268|nr:RagB/SusD family nutrient uptake outer membrane protein [Polaribacter sp.]